MADNVFMLILHMQDDGWVRREVHAGFSNFEAAQRTGERVMAVYRDVVPELIGYEVKELLVSDDPLRITSFSPN